MAVEIDYPLPGATVAPTFTVGGTYDSTDRAMITVTATLYQSDGTTAIVAATTDSLAAGTGPWSVSLTAPPPPYTDCILKAVLSSGGTDEVDDIGVQPSATGWISNTPS